MRLRSIHIPVADVNESIKFYADVLGLQLKFQDEDRYAALRCGEIDLVLVRLDDAESPNLALAVKTSNLPTAIDEVQQGGATLARAPRDGAHETRALIKDPAGHDVVLYQSQ